ncbi:MAG: hypothetical protein GC160_28770 [Acidobacteria bacterium]|nr:hypothetical protein [Acidobacteriota bacterium]
MIGWQQWLPAAGICLLLALISWRLRRAGPAAAARSPLQTLGSLPLSAGQRLLAVRAGGRVFLLGVGPQSVVRVGEMGWAEWDETAPAEPPQQEPRSLSRAAGESR